MRRRTPWALLAAALLLGAYIVAVERRTDDADRRRERARRAVAVRPEAVTRLVVRNGDARIECVRDNGRWTMVQPLPARADAAAVERLLAALEQLPRGDVVTEADRRRRGTTLDDYGLQSPRIRVAWEEDGAARELLVGRPARVGGRLYVREAAGTDIVATDTNLLAVLPASAVDVRDRTIFSGALPRARRFEMRRPDGFLQASRVDGGAWQIQQPFPARADRIRLLAVIDHILSLRIEEFVRAGAGPAAAFGFEESGLDLTLDFDDAPAPTTMRIGGPVPERPDLVYGRISGDDAVFAVPQAVLDLFRLSADDLRDRRLLPLLPDDVAALRLAEGERAIDLFRGPDGWRIASPVAAPADEGRMVRLLEVLATAKVESFLDGATNAAERGLDPAPRRLALWRHAAAADGPPPAARSEADAVVLGLGSAAGEGRRHARVGGEGLVVIDDEIDRHFSVQPLSFRDRRMLALDPARVESIALQRGTCEQRLQRGPSGAFAPPDAPASAPPEAEVQARLRIVADLRATALVADQPGDLAAFGLQPPAALLTFGLGGEAGLGKSLLIGKETDRGTYAMVRGPDVVFLLEAARAAWLTRDLYAPPDPAPATNAPAAP